MSLEVMARKVFLDSPVYKPLRFAYQAVFDRQAIDRRRRRRAFYSQFIEKGSLVFDVGANLGNYAEAFLDVGAVVVAVEPDPRNLEVLHKRLKGKRIHIEPSAVGRSEGTALLYLADRSDVSTLSRRWTETVTAKWHGTATVTVRTLDALARQYGLPRYVKVDVEGFDYEVLSGMTFPVPIVSFEFHPLDLSIAENCVGLFNRHSFNYVIEERASFELNGWVGKDEILAILSSLPDGVLYGDVFARAS